MKIWKWLLISIGSVTLILLFFMIVPVLIMDKSWWWFFIPLIFFIITGLVVGLIFLIVNIQKKPVPKIKIDLKDAKNRVIHEAKYDDDNPDNFKIEWTQIVKIGRRGTEKTPIAVFHGKGTEKGTNRVAIVNLNNPKHETEHLIDPTEQLILDSIRLISDNPPEDEIKEEITSSVDRYGRPITITNIRRPSSAEIKEEQEKKEAEERGAI